MFGSIQFSPTLFVYLIDSSFCLVIYLVYRCIESCFALLPHYGYMHTCYPFSILCFVQYTHKPPPLQLTPLLTAHTGARRLRQVGQSTPKHASGLGKLAVRPYLGIYSIL